MKKRASNIQNILKIITVFAVSMIPIEKSAAIEPGEQIFKDNCGVCHTIGGGRLVGPDLAGVHDKRSQNWLIQFIKSSQAMVNDGDVDAVAIFKEFNGMPMPDATISENQILEVLSYLKSGGSADSGSQPVTPQQQQTTQVAQASGVFSEEDIRLGQDLFQGTLRFENGGPTCNACHDVKNDAVIGGGILARDLTTVFSKMGGTGVRAILGSPPFPVMQAAYKDQPLTDKENKALVAFLEQADKEHLYQQPRDYGVGLFVSGMGGTVFLYVLFAIIWLKRKKGSVNQDIYDRQVKSSDL